MSHFGAAGGKKENTFTIAIQAYAGRVLILTNSKRLPVEGLEGWDGNFTELGTVDDVSTWHTIGMPFKPRHNKKRGLSAVLLSKLFLRNFPGIVSWDKIIVSMQRTGGFREALEFSNTLY